MKKEWEGKKNNCGEGKKNKQNRYAWEENKKIDGIRKKNNKENRKSEKIKC